MLEYVTTEMSLPGKAEAIDVILDLDDLNLVSAPFDLIRGILPVFVDNMRGRNGHIFIVNQGFILRKITQVFLSTLDEITRKKIFVLAPFEFEHTLLQFVDPENLEQRYGGQKPNVESDHIFAHLKD